MTRLALSLAIVFFMGCVSVHGPQAPMPPMETVVAISDVFGEVQCAGARIDRFVLTAKHCVTDEVMVSDAGDWDGGSDRFLRGDYVRQVITDPDHDIALLVTTGHGPTAEIATRSLQVGSPVTLVGMPAGIPFVVSRGYCASATRVNGGMTVLDINATFGDSGGPVFDQSGRIAGVFSGGPSMNGHTPVFGLMVPADTVRTFLSEH